MQDDLLQVWLRPSALEGAWALASASDGCKVDHLGTMANLLRTTYSSAGFDFDAAQRILSEVPPGKLERTKFFRNVFFEAMRRSRPAVLALAPRGREAFSAALPIDVAECLRRCGVLDSCPDVDAVRWFDQLTSLARDDIDQRLIDLGRQAERRSLNLEASRLTRMPGAPPAVWVALDDNSLGYDIRSFDLIDGVFVPKLIEVKSCAGHSLEFFLTRNECTVARRQPDRYWLHLWNRASGRLLEVRWPEIEPFLPSDTARGQWAEARLFWSTRLD